MKYLLDTCVISETRRKTPDPRLLSWLSKVDLSELYLSVVTVGELRRGACSAKDIVQRVGLMSWVDRVVDPWFAGRVVEFDLETAEAWGSLFGECVLRGRTPSVCDSMIAATALQNDLVLVTRNVADFQFDGLRVINPFE